MQEMRSHHRVTVGPLYERRSAVTDRAYRLLEQKFYAKLHLAGGFGRTEDASEIRAESGSAGNIKVRPIENVEYFPAELEAVPFTEREVSLKRHVDIGDTWRQRDIAPGVAERVLSRLKERRRIEPSLWIALISRQVRIP
jgi:hypothetical protein